MFTFWKRAGPLAVLLAHGYRLAVDHVAAVTVKLHHLARLVSAAALDVPVLGRPGRIAHDLCKRNQALNLDLSFDNHRQMAARYTIAH